MSKQNQAWARDILGHYRSAGPLDEATILAMAEDIHRRRLERIGDAMTCPEVVTAYLRANLAHQHREHFAALWLDTRHRPLALDTLFQGSIDGCSVHPREVVRAALKNNAAAVICAHNHPSGVAEPSEADRLITRRLQDALQLIEVRVLDHIVVTSDSCVSLAARGWL